MAAINDVVLVHIDGKPGFFARVDDISPDVKPGWWQVKLLVLTDPLQIYTWILDESQVDGAPFTMGGTPVMLEKVVAPTPKDARPDHVPVRGGTKPGAKNSPKVVPLRKKEPRDG